MGIKANILFYLMANQKGSKVEIAKELNIDIEEIKRVLGELENEGKIEIKSDKIIPIKNPRIVKARRVKRQIIKDKRFY